ncbi:uncharacterized protein LOC132196528 isoform X2 [Neocloeon triangulifer]|uniref:uncharacterized protein LOC132196528 isoform X2 n=1 Tax=Neocloeon triangulifer TaxID=2078957 RepID=UPI00286F0A3C|nr:uncharacterized protein LOC132196528 isoform X2 [Neocloeon triangulifer]XP_059475238.1 uncharacterized protein LOC132196528 isoform X2 [Neocloeon triangulifer]XP_059475239.1 uncharacterized protein LOC132196528 isoform X2 [Neocloeon triangulifer]XP_059475240.1 uncharacterized protein LOC132196528 isoform X2 [Neocloeon triangulifer]
MYAAAGQAIRQARKGKKSGSTASSRAPINPALLGVHPSKGDSVSLRNLRAASAAAAAAAGKSASLTTERRFSLSDAAAVQHRDKATKAHRRWVKKNRIRDASCGDDDDYLGVESSAANVVLYIGLGLVCIGMVISFVGLGEKGFKTAELRLIGPSLLTAGAFFCLLRVFFCTCPAACCCLCPEERHRRRKLKSLRRKQQGEAVLSSDDEKTVSTIVMRKHPLSKVNGNNKHVAIPITRLSPTPSPPPGDPQELQTHLMVPTINTSASLPNYISDSSEPVPGPSSPNKRQELVLNASMLV